MALKPEFSVMGGLAVAGVVYSIHSNFTPTIADMKGLPAGNKDIDGSERAATWLSIGVVSAISLLAKDPTIFVIGSAATVAMAFSTRHAVWTEGTNSSHNSKLMVSGDAETGNDLDDSPVQTTAIGDTQAYNMYAAASSDFG